MRTGVLAVILVALVPIHAAGAAVPPGGTFVDDDSSIHQGWIEAIAAADITRGCNPPANDRFCPEDPVTRGQMAAFLVRALDNDAAATASFTDSVDSPFADDISRLAVAGIARGCDPPANDRFCPDHPVTRGQMAAFLARAFALPDPGTNRFGDDDASVFEADIEAIAAAEITSGCDDGRYCPARPITRAEMAAFLGRALGLDPVEVPPRPTTIQVVPREQWAAMPPGGSLRPHDIEQITIHHAGSATGTTGPAQLREWESYHRSLGWPDLAYHFVVGRDGEVYEGRTFTAVGDTATEYDPTGHLLIVVEGNFDVDTPTTAQLEALTAMVAWSSQRFAVPVEETTGHRDHAATRCPGSSLYTLLVDGAVADRATALLDGGRVTLDYG